MENTKKTITIMGVETKVGSNGKPFLKIKDHENKTYNLFTTKKDGEETVAYQALKLIPSNGVGRNFDIAYNESSYEGQNGMATSRNIIGLREVGGNSLANTVAKNGMFNEKKETDEKKWEELGWKKCKYGFLIEAFKLGMKLETIENIAEKWADACQRDTRDLNSVKEETISMDDKEIKIEDIPF